MLPIILTSFSAFITSLCSIPFIIKFACSRNLYDPISHRKVHTEKTPRIGGIGIFLAFLLGVVLVNFSHLNGVSVMFLLSTGVLFIAGLYDDIYGLRPLFKLAAQICSASLFAIFVNSFSSVIIPLVDYTLPLQNSGPILTVFWIVAASNAINLIDGVDSLAGGVSFIASLSMGIYFLLSGSVLPSIVAFALAGGLTGFLVHNFPPAKIFMGDSGSLTIGFILAVLPLLDDKQADNPHSLLFLLTVLLVPLMDTLAAIIRRIREKRPIHQPDKHHLHHKLLHLGLRIRFLLMTVYALSLIPAVLAVIWGYLGFTHTLVLIGSAWATVIIFFIILDRIYRKTR